MTATILGWRIEILVVLSSLHMVIRLQCTSIWILLDGYGKLPHSSSCFGVPATRTRWSSSDIRRCDWYRLLPNRKSVSTSSTLHVVLPCFLSHSGSCRCVWGLRYDTNVIFFLLRHSDADLKYGEDTTVTRFCHAILSLHRHFRRSNSYKFNLNRRCSNSLHNINQNVSLSWGAFQFRSIWTGPCSSGNVLRLLYILIQVICPSTRITASSSI